MSEAQDGATPVVEPVPVPVEVNEEDNSTAGQASRLWPAFGKYRKFLAAIVTTSVPFAIFLADTRTTKEVIAAAGSYLLVNLGVYGVSND